MADEVHFSREGEHEPEHLAHHVPEPAHDRVGFVGLGSMGWPMASNLAAWCTEHKRPPLMVWNRTTAKAEAFAREFGQDGKRVKVAQSLEELAQSCDLVVTSLSNDAAAEAVYDELFKATSSSSLRGAGEEQGDGIRPGGRGRSRVFADTSTLYPSVSGALERKASQEPYRYYLQCPVFGPPPLAMKRQLVFVVSGEVHAKRLFKNIVPSMGRKTIDLGSDVERAAGLKLIGNFTILSVIESLSEAFTLAEKSGVGEEPFFEFVKTFLPAPSYLGYGDKIHQRKFDKDVGFTVVNGLKDASHIRRFAETNDCSMPTADLVHRHLVSVKARGGADLDWSSLSAALRSGAGLNPFKRDVPLERS